MKNNIKIEDTERKINMGDIELFEREKNINVPNEYKKFLVKYNGGSPTPENFEVSMDARPHSGRSETHLFPTAIEFFFSLDSGEISILSENHFVEDERVQNGMFPFAYCGGDLLCISTRKESSGKIFYWFSNEEYDYKAEGDRNLYFVADSFDELLTMLHS